MRCRVREGVLPISAVMTVREPRQDGRDKQSGLLDTDKLASSRRRRIPQIHACVGPIWLDLDSWAGLIGLHNSGKSSLAFSDSVLFLLRLGVFPRLKVSLSNS